MNLRLQSAFDTAAKLPDEAQEVVAALIEEQIEADQWERLLSQLRSIQIIKQLEEEAEREIAAGDAFEEP